MNISVIITTILVAQVSGSFFDVFQGAVLSVQNSFGKLLSDVVTDVKETVDCTILAVEHVLSLSHDATTRYYDKCSSGTNKTDSVSEAPQDVIVPKVEVTLNLPNNNEELLQKVIPAEIDARIDERLSKVLGNYNSHDNALSIQNVLAKESEQLDGLSVLVKKELEKLSNEVTTDLKNIEKHRESQRSVDNILQEIKILEQRERDTKNTTEAKEIHQVIDQVLGKLDIIEDSEATENLKLEEILTDLENNSNNSFVGLRHQFEEWKEEEARHLSDVRSKIEEHEKISAHHHLSHTRHGSDQIHPVLYNTVMTRDEAASISSSPQAFSKNITLVNGVLNNSTTSRTIADSNKFIITVEDETSFPENKKLDDRSVTTNFITKSSVETEVIYRIGTPTVVRSSEFLTLSTNESTTTPNNLIGDDAKFTIATSITESTPDNENILVDNITDDDKRHTLPTNETTTSLSPDENRSTQSVIPVQTSENTSIEDTTRPVKSNTDSRKEELADSITKIYTFIAETAVTEMTSTSQNSNNLIDTTNDSKTDAVVENTFVNEVFSIFPSYERATILAKFEDMKSYDTTLTSAVSYINHSTSVNETIASIENSTNTGKVESSINTTTITNDYDANDTSASFSIVENTQVSETIQPIETTTASDKEESTTTVVHDNNKKDITTSTPLPLVENTSVLENIHNEETSTTSSNNYTISSDSSPEVGKTTYSQTIEPEEITTPSGNEESLNGSNESIIASTLQIEENSIAETTIVSYNEESTEAVTELITTLKIENDSYTTVVSTMIPNIDPFETIDAATTTISSSVEKSLDFSATENPNIVGDHDNDDVDDSSATEVTSTADVMSETIPKKNADESEPDGSLTSITNSPKSSPVSTLDNDSDTDFITNTMVPIQETTTAVIEIIDLESTSNTPSENEEALILSKSSAENTNVVINDITETQDSVTSYTENTDSAVVSEIIQPVETATTTKEQDLTSTSTQSATNEIVITSTDFPSTESQSESIMTSKNDLDLTNSTTVESNTSSRTQDIPDLNDMIKSPLLTITELSPPENRQRLTPNKLTEQNYDRNAGPRNNYDLDAPILLSDISLQTRQPLINPDVPQGMPMYDQPAMPPISRSAVNEAQRQAEAFTIFDSIDKRLSHSDSPFGSADDIPIANIPSTLLLGNLPWKPIDPPGINVEKPSFLPPLYPIRPLPFDDVFQGNVYRPQGLTTQRSRNANYYKNPSIDYDSFFHSPPRNSEAHQRALQEARQIMANSKRSERIINNVMQNKNKFNARTIFNR